MWMVMMMMAMITNVMMRMITNVMMMMTGFMMS